MKNSYQSRLIGGWAPPAIRNHSSAVHVPDTVMVNARWPEFPCWMSPRVPFHTVGKPRFPITHFLHSTPSVRRLTKRGRRYLVHSTGEYCNTNDLIIYINGSTSGPPILMAKGSARQGWVVDWAPTDLQNGPTNSGVVNTPLAIKLMFLAYSSRHVD